MTHVEIKMKIVHAWKMEDVQNITQKNPNTKLILLIMALLNIVDEIPIFTYVEKIIT
jgi:hypothetical protein